MSFETPPWDALDPSETDWLEAKARCSKTPFVHIVKDNESYLCGIGRFHDWLLDEPIDRTAVMDATRCKACIKVAERARKACEVARHALQIEKGYRYAIVDP